MHYIGLMSGTSVDGIDAALVSLSAGSRPVLVATHAHPIAAATRGEIQALMRDGPNEIERLGELDMALGELFAEAANAVIKKAGLANKNIRAIGSHGQTLRHRPRAAHPFTLQIGNPSVIAERTGITTVADFRARDIAAGGQGAPLVPAFHASVFGHRSEDRVVVNIGGIANVTRLPPGGGPVSGFDCGPGNCLLDLWVQKHLGAPLDTDGAWAAGGIVAPQLLQRLLEEPFIAAPPPKSTGRELFNESWLSARLRGEEPRAVQATLLEFTARCIADACRGAARAIVCGGGASNGALLRRLAALLAPVPVEASDRHGIPATLVEALAFAWLAKQAIEGVPAGLPGVTGARGPRILGALHAK